MELTQKVSLNQNVLMQDLNGEAVFLNCDREEYFSLDVVGTRMLMVLQQSQSIESAYEVLIEEYEVDPEKLRQDLLALVQELEEYGLVEITSS